MTYKVRVFTENGINDSIENVREFSPETANDSIDFFALAVSDLLLEIAAANGDYSRLRIDFEGDSASEFDYNSVAVFRDRNDPSEIYGRVVSEKIATKTEIVISDGIGSTSVVIDTLNPRSAILRAASDYIARTFSDGFDASGYRLDVVGKIGTLVFYEFESGDDISEPFYFEAI